MPKPLPGPEYESVEFQRSPAYADFRAALEAVECATYADLLAASRSRRDRFHEEWTARMRERCGMTDAPISVVDADAPPLPSQRFFFPKQQGGRGRRDTALQDAIAQCKQEGMTLRQIAAAVGRSENTVKVYLYGRRHRPTYVADSRRLVAIDRRAIAKRLRKAGMANADIAQRLGIHVSTVYDLLAPETAEQRKERYRVKGQRQMQAARAAQEAA